MNSSFNKGAQSLQVESKSNQVGLMHLTLKFEIPSATRFPNNDCFVSRMSWRYENRNKTLSPLIGQQSNDSIQTFQNVESQRYGDRPNKIIELIGQQTLYRLHYCYIFKKFYLLLSLSVSGDLIKLETSRLTGSLAPREISLPLSARFEM